MTTSQDSKLTTIYNDMTTVATDRYNTGYTNGLKDGSLTSTLLWTNPSLSSAFAAQTISLDLTDYIGVFIRVKDGPNYNKNNTFTYVLKNGGTVGIASVWLTSAGLSGMSRNATATDTGITFGIGGFANNGAMAQDSSYAIPYQIYGIKTWIE